MISLSRYFNPNGMMFLRNEMLIDFVSIPTCVFNHLFAFLPRVPNVTSFELIMLA